MSRAFDYEARYVVSRPTVNVNGCRMKCYEMFCDRGSETEVCLPAESWTRMLGKVIARTDDIDEHRAGFGILHHARDGTYLLASRWYGGNMLKHEVFTVRDPAQTCALESLAPTTIIACVWELEVIKFERDAWVRTAMAGRGATPAIEAYFSTSMAGWA